MSFACFVFSIGKNVSYISLGTGLFALGTPPFTVGADSVEKPLWLVIELGRDILPTNIFTKLDKDPMKTLLLIECKP